MELKLEMQPPTNGLDIETVTKKLAGVDQELLRPSAPRPCYSFWPSKAGHPCLRNLWFMRTRWEDAAPIDPGLANVFWLGKQLEPVMVARVAEAANRLGWSFLRLRRGALPLNVAFVGLPTPKVVGYVDGVLEVGYGMPFVGEIKWLAGHTFGQLNRVKDLDERKEPWLQSYRMQLWLYIKAGAQHGLTRDGEGMMIIGSKSTGQVKFLPDTVDEDRFMLRMRALAHVEKLVEEKDTEGPQRIVYDEFVCDRCEFKHLCLPSMTGGLNRLEVSEICRALKPEFERMMALSPGVKEHGTITKRLRTAVVMDLEPGAVGTDTTVLFTDTGGARVNWRKNGPAVSWFAGVDEDAKDDQ